MNKQIVVTFKNKRNKNNDFRSANVEIMTCMIFKCARGVVCRLCVGRTKKGGGEIVARVEMTGRVPIIS